MFKREFHTIKLRQCEFLNHLSTGWIFFANSILMWTSLKVSLWQWNLPLKISVSVSGCECGIKRLLEMFFLQKMGWWWAKDTVWRSLYIADGKEYLPWHRELNVKVSDNTCVGHWESAADAVMRTRMYTTWSLCKDNACDVRPTRRWTLLTCARQFWMWTYCTCLLIYCGCYI